MRYAIVTCSVLAVACGASETSPGSPTGMSDAQIVGVLHEINQTQTQESGVALELGVGTTIVEFANEVISDTTSADAALTQAAASVSVGDATSATSAQVKATTATQCAALSADLGSDFDATYIDFQVNDAEAALQTIDDVLTPAVLNDVIWDQIQATRALVASHVAQAQTLLGGMD